MAWLAPNTQELLARYRPALGFERARAIGRRAGWLVWRPTPAWSCALGLATAIVLMRMWVGDNAEFLYFQF